MSIYVEGYNILGEVTKSYCSTWVRSLDSLEATTALQAVRLANKNGDNYLDKTELEGFKEICEDKTARKFVANLFTPIKVGTQDEIELDRVMIVADYSLERFMGTEDPENDPWFIIKINEYAQNNIGYCEMHKPNTNKPDPSETEDIWDDFGVGLGGP